jgi:hypothetical protein
MKKSDRERVKELSREVSDRMAEIQRIVGRKNVVDARIKFPRGYVRTTGETRNRLPVLQGIFDETKIRNICYSLQMADVLRWLAIRTDLSGMLLSQAVKEYICIYGHAIDYLLDAACRQVGVLARDKEKPFNKRSSLLVADRHIKPSTKKEIDWVWDVRCREHPDRLEELETDTYSREQADRARKAFEHFCEESSLAVVASQFENLNE